MRLAIATDGDMVSAHFGHCSTYTLVDIEDGKVASQNAIPAPPHQPGFLPPFLAEKGVNVVIAGGMGPRAQDLFASHGIRVIPGVAGSIEQVIEAFIAGTLTPGENLCDSHHHGSDHECRH